jgi:hypothetical protein
MLQKTIVKIANIKAKEAVLGMGLENRCKAEWEAEVAWQFPFAIALINTG